MFAVFSPLSGETHLLNGTAVWVLELLSDPGWHDPADVVQRAALESDASPEEIEHSLRDIWGTLVDCGLVLRRHGAAQTG